MNTCARTVRIGLSCLLVSAFLTSSTGAVEVKSPRKAAFLSILLPGTGELYAGGPRSGRFFLFTEGLFWTGLFAFKKLNTTRERTFKSFAAAHARAPVEGKPASYFDELVNFRSIYDRNHRARYLEGERATLRPETPDNIWEWDSENSRNKFRELRSKATWTRTRSLVFTGALIFNRFASAINAAYIASKTIPVEIGVIPQPSGGMQALLYTHF
ncbi:MAG: hypothetical protein O7G87_22465 [bacterium]|nr:hypothetical protein [bacterium]